MHVSKRKGLALLVCAAFAGSAFSAVGAFGHGLQMPMFRPHVHVVLQSDLIGNLTAPNDPKIHGQVPGGAAWKIRFGRVALFSNGGIVVVVRGLLITGTNSAADNTVGPVVKVGASLWCGADATTVAAAMTKSVALDANGNATIVDKVKLPARCLAPIVLINPTVSGGMAPAPAYIAASGFTTM
jgi:hypothetical protein